jgi:hypothetical protein
MCPPMRALDRTLPDGHVPVNWAPQVSRQHVASLHPPSLEQSRVSDAPLLTLPAGHAGE